MLMPALSGILPDRPDAVRIGGMDLSWAALRDAADAVAADLAGADAVAVLATPSLETVAAMIGGLLAGVPVVPIPPDVGRAEIAHVLADSRAGLLLAGDPHDPVLDGVRIPVVPVALDRRSSASCPEPEPSRPGLILYTSGTTGRPKGVVISRRALAAGLDAVAEAWAWTSEDTLVHGLPLYHVHGLVLGLLGPLRLGSALRHTRRPTPQGYATAGGSLYFGVPTVWSRICAEVGAARALASARLLVSGSAPLPAPVFERLVQLTGHRPIERYGMTETLITVSARVAGERRAGEVGLPLRGVDTRLVDEDGRLVPWDGSTFGELQVRGETLFDGYLNLPAVSTATYSPDGWFRTGDVATIDEQGRHRIVGRASTDMIKSGGYRIGAGEIEDCLLSHPLVREAAVVGMPCTDLGQEVVAFVVTDGAVSPDALIAHVATQLARHKRPRRVHLVDALPRNALGKVQKTLLVQG